FDSTGYGVCFSPDNSKLYFTTWNKSLYQFYLSSGDSSAMVNSRILVGNCLFSQLRLGPDGRIYFYINANVLGSIDAPNQAGAACQFNTNAVNFLGNVGAFGLPNVVTVFKRDTLYSTDTLVGCGGAGVLL